MKDKRHARRGRTFCAVTVSRLMPPSLQRARILWKPHRYDLVLLDVRQQFPGEAVQFYEQIRDASPGQHFAFLVGPPLYVSRRWPLELAFEDNSRGQWGETVTRFLAAA